MGAVKAMYDWLKDNLYGILYVLTNLVVFLFVALMPVVFGWSFWLLPLTILLGGVVIILGFFLMIANANWN